MSKNKIAIIVHLGVILYVVVSVVIAYAVRVG